MRKLSVGSTVRESYALFLSEFGALLRSAWGPVILMIVVLALANQATSATNPGIAAVGLLLLLLTFIFNAMAFVRWHRFVILGETEQDRPIFAFRREEGRYILSWLVVLAIGLGIMIIPGILIVAGAASVSAILSADGGATESPAGSLAALAGSLLFLATAIFVYCRLMLVMPNAAVRSVVEVRAMFAAARGNTWRVFLIMLAVMLPILVVSSLPTLLLSDFSQMDNAQPIGPLEAWLSAVVGVLIQPLVVVAESIIYIKLVELPQAARARASASD